MILIFILYCYSMIGGYVVDNCRYGKYPNNTQKLFAEEEHNIYQPRPFADQTYYSN